MLSYGILLFYQYCALLLSIKSSVENSFNYFVYSLIRDVIKNYIKTMFKIVNLWYYIKYVTYNKNITIRKVFKCLI